MVDDPLVSRIDYERPRAVVNRMVMRFGRIATLVNNQTGVKRWCRVALVAWSAKDLYGGLYDPLSRKALFSTQGLSSPPDHEHERLLVYAEPLSDRPVVQETLLLDKRAVPVNPGGIVLYWWLPVFNIT